MASKCRGAMYPASPMRAKFFMPKRDLGGRIGISEEAGGKIIAVGESASLGAHLSGVGRSRFATLSFTADGC